VARPVAVSAISRTPRHRKCSDQTSRRGLNKANFGRRLRINGRLPRSFTKRTGDASQRQIVYDSFAAQSDRRYVVNMKGCFLACLRQVTVLASVAG